MLLWGCLGADVELLWVCYGAVVLQMLESFFGDVLKLLDKADLKWLKQSCLTILFLFK